MLAGKGSFAFSVAGVAVATMLLSFTIALYRGWSERLTAFIDDTNADLWVVQKGAESFFTVSVVNNRNVAWIGALEGVERLSTLAGKTIRIHVGEEPHEVLILGFDPEVEGSKVGGLGGPLRMERGSPVPKAGEIIIDDILAQKAGLDIGDELQAGDATFKVAGISSGGNLGVTIVSFVTAEDANRLIGDYPIVNYILVNVAPGQESAVTDAIRKANPALDVFPREEFAASSRQVLRQTILPVLGVVVVLVFAVGAIVVALTIYTATIEKEREFGVLKALGTPGRSLFGVVLQQSLVCCALGFVLGEFAAVFAAWAAKQAVPQFVTLIKPADSLFVLLAVLFMGAVAAWLPIQRINRVDPLTVFKA